MDKLTEMARLAREPEFRAKLHAAPAAALAGLGVNIAPGVELRVVEDRADVQHFVLPPAPNALLADSSLDSVSGGIANCQSSLGSCIEVALAPATAEYQQDA